VLLVTEGRKRWPPLVVASLAALSFVAAKKFRYGFLGAALVLGGYLFVVWPVYVGWIHGSGRSHFPAVNEPAEWRFDDVPTEINALPETK